MGEEGGATALGIGTTAAGDAEKRGVPQPPPKRCLSACTPSVPPVSMHDRRGPEPILSADRIFVARLHVHRERGGSFTAPRRTRGPGSAMRGRTRTANAGRKPAYAPLYPTSPANPSRIARPLSHHERAFNKQQLGCNVSAFGWQRSIEMARIMNVLQMANTPARTRPDSRRDLAVRGSRSRRPRRGRIVALPIGALRPPALPRHPRPPSGEGEAAARVYHPLSPGEGPGGGDDNRSVKCLAGVPEGYGCIGSAPDRSGGGRDYHRDRVLVLLRPFIVTVIGRKLEGAGMLPSRSPS